MNTLSFIISTQNYSHSQLCRLRSGYLSDAFKNTRYFTDVCSSHGGSFDNVGVGVNGRLVDNSFQSSPEEEIQTTQPGDRAGTVPVLHIQSSAPEMYYLRNLE